MPAAPVHIPAPALNKLLKLSELAIGASATVRELPKSGGGAGGAGGAALRLSEMGVVPGVRITLVRVAPLGDPFAFKVRGSILTLRKRDAAHVLVEAAG